jgi:hypothetical protein
MPEVVDADRRRHAEQQLFVRLPPFQPTQLGTRNRVVAIAPVSARFSVTGARVPGGDERYERANAILSER